MSDLTKRTKIASKFENTEALGEVNSMAMELYMNMSNCEKCCGIQLIYRIIIDSLKSSLRIYALLDGTFDFDTLGNPSVAGQKAIALYDWK